MKTQPLSAKEVGEHYNRDLDQGVLILIIVSLFVSTVILFSACISS